MSNWVNAPCRAGSKALPGRRHSRARVRRALTSSPRHSCSTESQYTPAPWPVDGDEAVGTAASICVVRGGACRLEGGTRALASGLPSQTTRNFHGFARELFAGQAFDIQPLALGLMASFALGAAGGWLKVSVLSVSVCIFAFLPPSGFLLVFFRCQRSLPPSS